MLNSHIKLLFVVASYHGNRAGGGHLERLNHSLHIENLLPLVAHAESCISTVENSVGCLVSSTVFDFEIQV